MVITAVLSTVSLLLLLYFGCFAAYNYAYSIAALFPSRIPTVVPRPDAKVAVVVVSFNEREVLADTIAACEQLSYPGKTVIVGDDSKDPETIDLLRKLAADRGCLPATVAGVGDDVEIWESERFVVFHRADNVGFKAGNLKALEGYLRHRGFDYMYLLDADWRPQTDAIERCLEVIEADTRIAYVQTKRLYHHGPGDHFQRCLAINEEACYVVDLAGRQRLGHMVLFSGCCALFHLPSLYAVGGFRAGHLTEDIDLSNRFYLAGYRGVYLGSVANVGEVPPSYRAFRRQQERWAIGSARTFVEYLVPVLRSDLDLRTKLSLLRQNAYYTAALGIEVSVLWCVVATLCAAFGGARGWAGSAMAPVMVLTLFGSVLPLIVATGRKRSWSDLLYIPAACWISLSVVHTYAVANIKGFRRRAQTWFVTPKTNRRRGHVRIRGARRIRAVSMVTLLTLAGAYAAAYQVAPGSATARVLIATYAVLWIPSMLIAAWKS
ncbi:glycosyltransferase family 2 protein [Actinoplanes sp. NPDC051475]|uniref:glycosyltransferase family 2 protein n=1 Tax=Actinoplanes sp. NPDC051475 TaxID=3157225 RepID=UPI00344BEA55